jgi:Domain of unknown function (DUF929)
MPHPPQRPRRGRPGQGGDEEGRAVPPRGGPRGARVVYGQPKGGHRRQSRSGGRQARQRRNRQVAFAVAAVVVVFGAVGVTGLALAGNDSRYTPRTPANPSTISHITTIPAAGLATAVAAVEESPTPLQPAYVLHSSLTSEGKPEVLLISAEFCPGCATEGWPIVVALSQFGTFSHLSQIRSANRDGDIAGPDFYGSSYASPYLTFAPVEDETNQPSGAGYKPLQTPTSAEETTWAATDVQAGLSGPSFPFLDIGGRYVIHSSQISDASLSGLDWKRIATNIGNNGSTLGARIDGSAGALVAYICAVTDDKPSSVCRAVANAEAPVMTPPTPGAT